MTEDNLIAFYFAPLVKLAGAWGLIDDAATLDVPQGMELVITTDTLIQDVHFYANDPPYTIAQKALRVNLSDLAAKGATPYAYTLNFGVPHGTSEAWVKAFTQGFFEDGEAFNISLIGGDTVKSPVIMLTITAFGLVPKGKIVRRTQAQTGDYILVSGTIGDAALGLQTTQGYYRERYLVPQPRIELIDYVREHASASMDISDGLIGDLTKLLKASQKGAKVRLEHVPLYAPLSGEDFTKALTGGDDYELLLCVPKAHYRPHPLLTIIGEVQASQEVEFLYKGEKMNFTHSSYSHF